MTKNTSYIPPKKILERYADVLVNFALNDGKGIKKDDTVYLVIPECAKPLLVELKKTILKAGGNIILDYRPSDDKDFKLSKDFYDNANDKQLNFFPAKYMRGLIDDADHKMFIISEDDKHSLKDVDPKKIMTHNLAFKPFKDWQGKKESTGKFTWTVALYGTSAMAKEVKLSEEEYWDQIIKACFLNESNPIKKWKEVFSKIEQTKKKLNKLKIDKLHIKGSDVDLMIKVGGKRRWIGGGGSNIPSFEVFMSPDWREAEGCVKFSQPLYSYGNLIEDIELEFKNGVVVKSKAKKGERVLKRMIEVKNADKIGEFSLTDNRFSKITKFMAETLYDENTGGLHGNFHIALGSSYHDSYDGDASKLSKKDLLNLGFNDSSVHADIVSTTSRVVTAHLKSGKQKIIYKNGKFSI
ncbi:aminopeptidase [bacterium]|jgi:aminopeptidase|nr:aminopeptidase [bacterium]